MGIGCACAQENACGHQYSCIIAVSRDTEARDITERIPIYQDILTGGDKCSYNCAYSTMAPWPFMTQSCAEPDDYAV